MAEHRQEFERDLEAIEARIIELFAMIAEDMPEATNALLTGNNEIMQKLLERDKIISALYPETEQLANREILLQAPVADDLRFLLSVLRVLTEFELSHDLVHPDRLPGQPLPRRRPLAAYPGDRRADGEPGRRHVAPGRRLLVPAGPGRGARARRAGRRDGPALLQPDRRAGLGTA